MVVFELNYYNFFTKEEEKCLHKSKTWYLLNCETEEMLLEQKGQLTIFSVLNYSSAHFDIHIRVCILFTKKINVKADL